MSREMYEDELNFATFMIEKLQQLQKDLQEEVRAQEYETKPFFRSLLITHTPGDSEEPYGSFAVDSDGNWSYTPV